MATVTLDHKLLRELFLSDPEFTIQVKRAILKTALQSEINKLMNNEAQKVVSDYAAKAIGKFRAKVGFAWKLPDDLRREIRTVIYEEYHAVLKEELDARKEYFIRLIDSRITDSIKHLASREVTHILSKAMRNAVTLTAANITTDLANTEFGNIAIRDNELADYVTHACGNVPSPTESSMASKHQ